MKNIDTVLAVPRRLLRLTGILALGLLAGCASTTPASRPGFDAGLGGRLLSGYIWPRTQELVAGSALLRSAVEAYCARPVDSLRRIRLEQQLGDTVAAWARVEILRFGPLVEANRLEQFFFWPDPRAVVQRQMRGLLSAADPAMLESTALRQQSVAVQGLPALEFALYADDAPRVIASGDAAGQYRCAYATAIAGNLQRLAAEIATGWSGAAPLAAEFARPSGSGKLYRNDGEVAAETLKALSTALHAMQDQKLAPAMGDSAASARDALLPLYRSSLTARYLAAGIDGMAAWHAAAALGTALPADSLWVDGALRDELRRLLDDFEALDVPVAQAIAGESRRDLMTHVLLLLANARALVDEYLAPALDVNPGFNALDGD